MCFSQTVDSALEAQDLTRLKFFGRVASDNLYVCRKTQALATGECHHIATRWRDQYIPELAAAVLEAQTARSDRGDRTFQHQGFLNHNTAVLDALVLLRLCKYL